MAEHSLGLLADFPPGSSKVVQIHNLKLGIFNVDGAVYALPNICPHQYGPLCEGGVGGTMANSEETDWRYEWVREGEILTCPWHGMEFDITTGCALANPRMKVRQYLVRIEDGEVILST